MFVGNDVASATVDPTSTTTQSVACFLFEATWINETHIACVAPPFSSGVVKVEVTTNDFDYTLNNIEYEYRELPTITSISPAIGSTDGGTKITVTGSRIYFLFVVVLFVWQRGVCGLFTSILQHLHAQHRVPVLLVLCQCGSPPMALIVRKQATMK